MSESPKAIIFDYGQVLSLPQNDEAHRELVELSGVDPELFDRRYWAHRSSYDRGTMRAEQFWRAVLGLNGAELDPGRLWGLVEADIRSWTDVNEPLLRWLLALPTRKVRLALLSNMPADIRAALRLRFGWLERFAVQVYSCEVGVVKPEPAIYRHCLQKLKLKAAQVVFVDDREENVEAARRLGLRTVLYQAGVTPLDRLTRGVGLSS